MTQKQFVIGFLILVAIAVVGIVYSRLPEVGNLPVADQLTATNEDQSNEGLFDEQGNIISTPSAIKMNTKKQYSSFPGELPKTQIAGKIAVIETNKGVIEFELDADSPKAASNFIKLTQDGFYDNLTFHRVVPGFVIQGGDPKGDGTGGPGYKFEDEEVTKPYQKGTVAMANAGPNTNGSQFFIVLEDNVGLQPNYTIFGKVTIGLEVVAKIQIGDLMKKVTIK